MVAHSNPSSLRASSKRAHKSAKARKSAAAQVSNKAPPAVAKAGRTSGAAVSPDRAGARKKDDRRAATADAGGRTAGGRAASERAARERATSERAARERAASQARAAGAPAKGAARADYNGQLASLFSAGVGFTQAGLSLGMGLLNSFASMQEQMVQRLRSGEPLERHPARAAEPEAVAGPQTAPEAGVTHALPLSLGGAVYLSLSLNNDSRTETKAVTLELVGLQGEQGLQWPAATLTVTPTRCAIRPLDFEKIVISGSVPAELAPDIYHGHIAVSGAEQLQIPVRFVVEAPLGAPRSS